MRKLVLIAIAFVSFTMIANAQDVKFGFKGGVNLATLNGDDIGDQVDGRTGYHLGAVVQLSLAETIALQPELLYSAQGVDDTDIDYLNLPVLFKLKFAKVLSVEAGPQFGFVVNDSFEVGEPESFDLSGAIGAGVEFGGFFGQLRYNHGFTNVIEDGDAKNSNFQISVGYYIF